MGTLLAVTFAHADRDAELRWADIAFTTAATCERVMSRHDHDSDLSRLNQDGVSESRTLASVLERACALAEKTGGAFDPTVAPVLDLWRRAAQRGTVPSRSAVANAQARVNWRAIQLDRTPVDARTTHGRSHSRRDSQAIQVEGADTVFGKTQIDCARVALSRRGAALDLGAIGKGLALDRIVARLRRTGCGSAILNFGESSLVGLGSDEWTVALRHPHGGFAGEFTLRDRACSTSGTTGQTITIGRRRASHVIDPRTGMPLRGVAQATVVARSAAVAEAASTALLVLGADALDDLAKRLHVEACWIDAHRIKTTPGFVLRGRAG